MSAGSPGASPAASPAAASSEFASGWPLVAASFLGIAFSVSVLGAGYSLGLFVQPLEAEFGWGRGQIQLAPLVLAGSVIPMSFVVGWIADRLDRLQRLTVRDYLTMMFGALVFLLCVVALWR